MAYNNNKGPQHSGDIQFEGDPNDTQIDFENDFVAIKTNGQQRFIVSSATITASVNISGSGDFETGGSLTADDNNFRVTGNTVRGNEFRTPATRINSTHVSSSLNISGSKFYANGVLLTPGVVSAVANGVDNRVATFSSADALNGEANLTFDGTDLGVSDKIFHVGDTDTYINFTTDDINITAGGVNFLDLTEDTQNEATFNEAGADIDFRIESANDTHMIFVDGANDAVSIGVSTDAPSAVLEVEGDAAQAKPTLTINHAEDTNNAVNINADAITTAKALRISADALTTGNALYIDDNSANTGTRNTAMVIQNNAAAIAATALTVQSDGGVTGVNLDKNYSSTAEASIVGINIDFDKTGASTTDNNMFGIQLDMDNTTATNGNNTMYGLYVTPTLTHAANAGTPAVKGAVITATAGSNGTSTATGMELTATGADTNEGLIINCADGGRDLKIVSSADTGDYFQIQTTTAGATTITTVDDNAAAAHLTFNVDGDITLDPAGGDVLVDGNVSGSGTLQAVGATTLGNTLSVSGNVNIGGPNLGNATLYVDHDDNAFSIFKSPSHPTILAVTGSGKVAVGGAHLDAKFNITGSDSDILISAKSNSNNPAFKVEGNGNTLVSGSLTVSGSLRAKQLHMTTHKYTPGNNTANFIRFDTNGSDTSAGDNNKLVAPFSGKLIKIVARGTSAPGSTVAGLHRNTDGNQNVSGTATEEITVNMSAANTSFTFTFTDTANYGPGDIVGIKINPASDPGTMVLTSVWEFDHNS
jgi:hypothetical protein